MSGFIRIIGGHWKRSRLPVPERPGLRPTPDRVRETLFNWLGQSLTGWQVFDMFAGTGALGLEAASRGAARVWLAEQDARLAAALQQHRQRLLGAQNPKNAQTPESAAPRSPAPPHIEVLRGDGIAALRQLAPRCAGGLDLVFIDPPYAQPRLYLPALQAAAAALRPGGLLYLEADHPWADRPELPASALALRRHLKAGAVHAHLLQKQTRD